MFRWNPENFILWKHSSLRLILFIIAQRKWENPAIDIKAGFLQGEQIQKKKFSFEKKKEKIEILVWLPKKENIDKKDWLLNKCIYELADATLKYYKKVKDAFVKTISGIISKVDLAVLFGMIHKI